MKPESLKSDTHRMIPESRVESYNHEDEEEELSSVGQHLPQVALSSEPWDLWMLS